MTRHHADPVLKIDSIGDLVAAVPALLGFYPTRSVILLAHDEVTGRIGATARTDLGLNRSGGLRKDCRAHIAEAVGMLRRQGADRLFCVVVDERPFARVVPGLLQVLEDAARSRDTIDPDLEIIDVLLLDRIEAEERWICRHGESGSLPDPAASPVMVAAVVEGRTVHRSRAELTDQLAEEGPGVTADRCRDAADGEADGDPCELLAVVVSAVAAQGRAPLSDADVALLGGALLDVAVRDAAMALGITVMADEARGLFEIGRAHV